MRSSWVVVLAAVLAFVGGCARGDGDPAPPAASASASPSASGSSAPVPGSPPATTLLPAYPDATPGEPEVDPGEDAQQLPLPEDGDFTLAVKITGKKCFGSAGCVVQYHIDLTPPPGFTMPAGGRYRVTYEVTGGEEGPVINSLVMTGDGNYEYDRNETVSTSGPDKKLRAQVIGIEPETLVEPS